MKCSKSESSLNGFDQTSKSVILITKKLSSQKFISCAVLEYIIRHERLKKTLLFSKLDEIDNQWLLIICRIQAVVHTNCKPLLYAISRKLIWNIHIQYHSPLNFINLPIPTCITYYYRTLFFAPYTFLLLWQRKNL